MVKIAGVKDRFGELPRADRAGRAGNPAGNFERPERAAEGLLLLVGNLGIADRQHAMARHRVLDRPDQRLVGRPGQIRADQFGGEQPMERIDLHRRVLAN